MNGDKPVRFCWYLNKCSIQSTLLSFFTGQISSEESLFYYLPGRSFEYYSNPDFMPDYVDDIVANAPASITTYCSSNIECIFDYVESGRQAVARITLVLHQNYTAQVLQAGKLSSTKIF